MLLLAQLETHIHLSLHLIFPCTLMHPSSYFVFDFPPRKLTNCEFNQHVEQRPQVVVTTHFLAMEIHVISNLHMINSSAGNMPCSPYSYEHLLKHIAQFLWSLPQNEAKREEKAPYTSNLYTASCDILPDDQTLTGRTSWLELANWRAKPKSSM